MRIITEKKYKEELEKRKEIEQDRLYMQERISDLSWRIQRLENTIEKLRKSLELEK